MVQSIRGTKQSCRSIERASDLVSHFNNDLFTQSAVPIKPFKEHGAGERFSHPKVIPSSAPYGQGAHERDDCSSQNHRYDNQRLRIHPASR